MNQIDRRFDIALPGLVDLLLGHVCIDALPPLARATLRNQAENVHAAAVSGVGAVADLVSAHNPSHAQLDQVGLGWLLHTLRDLLVVADTVLQEAGGARKDAT